MRSPNQAFCDGLSRRDMISIGGASLMGTTYSLTSILEGQAREASPGNDTSLIVLFLAGGVLQRYPLLIYNPSNNRPSN